MIKTSAHGLENLLNEFRKRQKELDLPNVLSFSKQGLKLNQLDKFDEFISPDEWLFERNMLITKHKSHLSNP